MRVVFASVSYHYVNMRTVIASDNYRSQKTTITIKYKAVYIFKVTLSSLYKKDLLNGGGGGATWRYVHQPSCHKLSNKLSNQNMKFSLPNPLSSLFGDLVSINFALTKPI
jgi:hypothetical protein